MAQGDRRNLPKDEREHSNTLSLDGRGQGEGDISSPFFPCRERLELVLSMSKDEGNIPIPSPLMGEGRVRVTS